MEIAAQELNAQDAYRWLTMTVIPRPIAWITTVSKEGQVNAAPFSFFTCVSSHPPLIGVTLMSRDGRPKDTLGNILDTHEFVINVVTKENLTACNLTSIDAPGSFSEIDYADLTLSPAATVSVPRLAESPVHLECRLNTVMRFGIDDQLEHPTHFVVGEVLHFGVDDQVLRNGKIDLDALHAIGRLSGPLYCTTESLLRLERPRFSDYQPSH